MESLYFGPSASTGIFHNEIRKSLMGLTGQQTYMTTNWCGEQVMKTIQKPESMSGKMRRKGNNPKVKQKQLLHERS